MKKLILVGILLLYATNAMGKVPCSVGSCDDINVTYPPSLLNCANKTTSCYTTSYGASEGLYSCNSCQAGYDRVSRTASFQTCSNTPTYYVCEKKPTIIDPPVIGPIDPPCPLKCTPPCPFGMWRPGLNGYERFNDMVCDCGKCITRSTKYRCTNGYYGSSTNGTTGCTQCPGGGTSAAGATVITGCYIPAATPQSDTSGSFEYTSNCYYSN